MKLLFVPFFAVLIFLVLSAFVSADRLTFSQAYEVEKPTDKPLQIPLPLEPLVPLAPRLPMHVQTGEQGLDIIRAQSKSVNELAEVLGRPPLLAQGRVDDGTINTKLIEPVESSEPDLDGLAKKMEQPSTNGDVTGQSTEMADPLGYTVLLAATVVTTIGLVYMAFVAYDYRQRWMHSLTTQNDRYLGGGVFDMETDDTYGSGSVSFSEGFGLSRHSI